jgi:hypothetical protein
VPGKEDDMSHTIEYEDLSEFRFERSVASLCGSYGSKSLDVVVTLGVDTIVYKVKKERKVVVVATDLREAIEEYNKI